MIKNSVFFLKISGRVSSFGIHSDLNFELSKESLNMGIGQISSPESHSGQLSDSYYSNHSNSSPEPERTGSKKTAYNEKWGVKVLKGKNARNL